jgi:hypothetical protein
MGTTKLIWGGGYFCGKQMVGIVSQTTHFPIISGVDNLSSTASVSDISARQHRHFYFHTIHMRFEVLMSVNKNIAVFWLVMCKLIYSLPIFRKYLLPPSLGLGNKLRWKNF